MARGPDAFFYGFTGIINHRFLTNQITRTISDPRGMLGEHEKKRVNHEPKASDLQAAVV